MAGLNGIISVSGISTVADTAKTLLQLIAGTNQRLRVKEIGVSFRGQVNTDKPFTVEVLYQTTAGTGGQTATPVKEADGAAETLQATALKATWSTTEPTAGSVIRTFDVHPQSGLVYQCPLGDEIVVGGGKRLGLRITGPVGTSWASGYIRYEE